VASLCSCRPLQSLAEQLGATAHAAPLPWSSPETGLGTLLRISRQCSLHAALRSGSSGLPRLLPGLTTDSACAGRGGPSRSSASHRRLVGIAASESSTWSSALLRSTFLLPGPAHAGLLSWGRTGRPGFPERLAPSPLRQLCTFSRRTVARPLPAMNRSTSLSAPGCQSGSPVPTPWYLTTSPAFSAQRLAGLLHPAADPGVCHVSHDQPRLTAIPATRPPLEGYSHPPVVLRSPGALAPLAFALADSDPVASSLIQPVRLVSRSAPSRHYPCGWSVTPTLVSEHRRPVLPGLLSPLRGHVDAVVGQQPRRRGMAADAPTVVAPSKLEVDWRDAGVDGAGR